MLICDRVVDIILSSLYLLCFRELAQFPRDILICEVSTMILVQRRCRVPWNNHKVNPFFQQMFVLSPVLTVLLVHKDGKSKIISATVLSIIGRLEARNVEGPLKISFQSLYSMSKSIDFMSELTKNGNYNTPQNAAYSQDVFCLIYLLMSASIIFR